MKKRIIFILFAVVIVGVLSIPIADYVVTRSAKDDIYTDINELPAKKVGLVLGTTKYTADGRSNLFYKYRLQSTVELYEAEKIQFVLVSGDNSVANYNEPEQMKSDLIDAGIPEERIHLDYAGFRTWDSVVRANKVFQENDFIIISQEFQNERALFAAEKNNIDAIAYNAQDVPVARSPRVWLRERLARLNAVWDAIINTQPHFLGKPIYIDAETNSDNETQEAELIEKGELPVVLEENVTRSVDLQAAANQNTIRLTMELPSDWSVEYIPEVEAINVYTEDGKGTAMERSQLFIRYFDAAQFLTLSTVDIFSTEDRKVGVDSYTARQYDIQKKDGVANFPNQPIWRNERHLVTDFRAATGYTRYYVVAANPEFDNEQYEQILQSIEIAE